MISCLAVPSPKQLTSRFESESSVPSCLHLHLLLVLAYDVNDALQSSVLVWLHRKWLSFSIRSAIISTLVDLFVEGVEKGDYEPYHHLSKKNNSKFALVHQVCSSLLQSSSSDLDSLTTYAKYKLSRYKRGYLADRKTQFTVSSFILTF